MPGKIVYLIKLYFLNTGYAGSLCCLRNCFGYRRSYSLIECLRNDIFRRKFLICDQICKCFSRCQFHFIIDLFALTSNAPRKIPGKASTLLIWFGKSLLPVETTLLRLPLRHPGISPESGLHMQKQLHPYSWS